MTNRWVVLGAFGLAGCCFSSTPVAAVDLAPGFQPQPRIERGQAGGINQANTLSGECRGNIPLAPQHVINVTAPIPNLSVLVNCGQDATLVIRTPQGTYLCNDDSEGYNPAITQAFGPGRYEIFVGAYNSNSTMAPYAIGFTEAAGALPSSIPLQ